MSGARDSADSQLIIRSLNSDLIFLRLHKAFPERYPYLLESAASGTEQGRYDLLFAFPGETLAAYAGEKAFLEKFDGWFQQERSVANEPDVPFRGGWFLYLSYELAGEVEPELALPINDNQLIAYATRIPVAIIRDHLSGKVYGVAEPGHEQSLNQLEADIAALNDDPAGIALLHALPVEEDPLHFKESVVAAKAHISDGDIYQANLSRQWHCEYQPAPEPWQLYERLKQTNPAPFAGLAVYQDFAVISSSPERLVSSDGVTVETRPIAGTRPRKTAAEISQAELDEFLGNEKERAEHVMLIDLERNDLGRICEGGTVEVNEFMTIESYSHVHHIVSNVVGRARKDVTPGDIIRAVFPGGTITGCPKVRCMEIIAEQEQRPRGAYTGSMGYVNLDGSLDLNILIRTMSLQNGELTLAAGSGIVADSDPDAELAETRAKAKGLLLALDKESVYG